MGTRARDDDGDFGSGNGKGQSMIASCADWFTAGGTLLIAALAIWGDHLRAWLWRPMLTLEEPDEKGHFTFDSNGRRLWYCHLIVRNRRPWCPARNCRVLLRAASRRGPDGRYDKPIQLYSVLQFMWSFPSFTPLTPMVVRNQPADLGVLGKDADAFRPLPYFAPAYFNGDVAKDQSILYEVEVEAENFVPTDPVFIEVSWDGQWSEDPEEMRKHLRVIWNPGEAGAI